VKGRVCRNIGVTEKRRNIIITVMAGKRVLGVFVFSYFLSIRCKVVDIYLRFIAESCVWLHYVYLRRFPKSMLKS